MRDVDQFQEENEKLEEQVRKKGEKIVILEKQLKESCPELVSALNF